MTVFLDFLKARLVTGGFSTEDTLASFLPLAKQVLEIHHRGGVAPLQGVEQVVADGSRLQFATDESLEVRHGDRRLRDFQGYWSTAIDIVSESETDRDVDQGISKTLSLDVVDEAAELNRPVYRSHYLAWEHGIDVHDPATDIFVLGLILASLACGKDLSSLSELQEWVKYRPNLFSLNPDIHPVVAQTIFRMTHLDRHRRSQDLEGLVYALENYRDQTVDIQFDLSAIPGFAEQDTGSRQQLIFSRLRERLFDLTRRNRLLNFQQNLQTVNLTQGSVPLSFNLREIRADQILVWSDALSQQVAQGKKISLNKHLNFAEAIYLPPLLDRLIADSRRDLAEFGFVQLRLVAVFLRWANLKENPKEIYQSPLVLIPVQLKKNKGIRDTYELHPQSELAEVNPVIRHLFEQLYAIKLPETIDLTESGLDALYEVMNRQILATEPAVELQRIDRPQVELIHEKARRKLEQYRRRARRYAKGQRTYSDLQYSYDPANFEPLGIQLFKQYVCPQTTQLDRVLARKERPRSFAAENETSIEHRKSLARVKSDDEGNPYRWSFDLCNLTLANFKYRKMSLVRDYDSLLDGVDEHQVFQSIFNTDPQVTEHRPETPPLEQRADILPCDPTQATAIARARQGESYIIQGPPGTGKSQTIANLIADYVSRGKRVLFVCEKRAAIDVVFARLKQCGIGHLACLIHDTQADKRDFVHNLRDGYDYLLERTKRVEKKSQGRTAVRRVLRELEPLDDFNRLMLQCSHETGLPVRELIERLLRLQHAQTESNRIDLDVSARERLPCFAEWYACREPVERLHRWIEYGNAGQPLSSHPFRWLAPSITQLDEPINLVSSGCDATLPQLEPLQQALEQAGRKPERWPTLQAMQAVIQWCGLALPVAKAERLKILVDGSGLSDWWKQQQQEMRTAEKRLQQHREETQNWKEPLSRSDARIALDQAVKYEAAWWRWLAPGWWKLRQQLQARYDFSAHPVRPALSLVLQNLLTEYDLQQAYDEVVEGCAAELGWGESYADSLQRLKRLHEQLKNAEQNQREECRELLQMNQPLERIQGWVEVGTKIQQLRQVMDSWFEDWLTSSPETWIDEVRRLPEYLDDLPDFLEALRILRDLPENIRRMLRELDLSHEQLEYAVVQNTLQNLWTQNRPTSGFDGHRRNRIQSELEGLYGDWLTQNASRLEDQVGSQLATAVELAQTPKREVDESQRELRDVLSQGLKELQREFKKSMRYRSIRDLVADETGQVIQRMKPVWLMSPLSVSDALPLDPQHFDVVIFDEASQITLEEAVPSLFRAQQAIVVGDEKQMPPTQFFRTRQSDDQWEDEEELDALGLEESSFLSHCGHALPSTLLGWHYRSRNESLISFSNWSFYSGRLLTAPEESLPRVDLPALDADSAADAQESVAGTLARPLSFHYLKHGCYEGRRNRAEAEYIAELVRALLEQASGLTLGIVAFSEAQQDEIESALERLAKHDPEFRERLDRELDREDQGQFCGLLVKNLENIQGDERDIVILSVCYGPDPERKLRMNFGPINQTGGEKRLNVAFSRAKHHMVVISSIRGEAITNDYNPGALAFKNYLLYADAMSQGKMEAADQILQSTHRGADDASSDAWEDGVIEPLVEWLEGQGFVADRNVGQSSFKCHVAVRRPEDTIYRLGILIDGKSYYGQRDLLERDLMRPKLLRDFGWQVSVLLAADWWQRTEEIKSELLGRLENPHPADK
jgi:DNA polymerase III delta prime subunit